MTPASVGNGWAGRRQVVVAVAHRPMREFIVELLSRDEGQWAVSGVATVSELQDTAPLPDLVTVDTADFAACCRQLPANLALARVVVIGPEPDAAYRHAALHGGAGAWLSREHVAEDLCDALRFAFACACGSPGADGMTSGSPNLAGDSDD